MWEKLRNSLGIDNTKTTPMRISYEKKSQRIERWSKKRILKVKNNEVKKNEALLLDDEESFSPLFWQGRHLWTVDDLPPVFVAWKDLWRLSIGRLQHCLAFVIFGSSFFRLFLDEEDNTILDPWLAKLKMKGYFFVLTWIKDIKRQMIKQPFLGTPDLIWQLPLPSLSPSLLLSWSSPYSFASASSSSLKTSCFRVWIK